MTSPRASAVFTLPAGTPFLHALARAVLAGDLPRPGGQPPADLSAVTILLPTRRAARALQEAFLAAATQRALLLPRIRPIAEGNEDLALLTALSGPATLDPGDADIPPAVGEVERRIVLTGLVQRWSQVMRRRGDAVDPTDPRAIAIEAGAGTAAQAAALASELARLVDEVETEGVDLSGLATMVPDRFSEHWQKTLEFLQIVLDWWPAYLGERGVISPMDRRNRLVLAEARRLAAAPPAGPVIVAGVTGSIPATAELIRVVAGLPGGAVVLPGVDQSLDEESWEAISNGVSPRDATIGESSSTEVRPRISVRGELRRTSVGDPALDSCEAHNLNNDLNNDASGDSLSWVPDAATRLKRRLPVEDDDKSSETAESLDHPEHPQFGLKRLIEALGVARSDVATLPGAAPPPHVLARNALVSEAMRPARTTERWHDYTRSADAGAVRAALAGVSLIEVPTPEDEAEVIALMLREVAETPERTAALVTRDRLLARRVAVRLEAWGIRVDDFAGRPLAKTMPGAFLDLLVEAVATDFAPAALVALLKHPLTRLGRPAGEMRRTARALEIAAFRTLYIGRGLDGVAAALDAAEQDVKARTRRGQAVERLRDVDWQAVRDLTAALAAACAPLVRMFETGGPHTLRDLVRAHVEAAEAVAQLPEGDRALGLWAEAAGDAASLLLTSLLDENLPGLRLAAREYPDLYRGLLANETVRARVPMHPRLAIWGPLEARLQQPDVVILGSLNDGNWPELGDPGPWLNRPMRNTLGLPSPEERIGHLAHDFTMLMGAPEVVLTRALKVDGVPKVASRWLLRLRALLEALEVADALVPEKAWLAWAQWRQHASAWKPIAAPAPRPPVSLRPRKLSVSSVETWMANPYAIYARDILRLEPLPLIGIEPDAALRGGIVHAALSEFAKQFPAALPADAAGELMRLARAELETLAGSPRVAAFWVMRLERFAAWFAASEPGRREGVARFLVEVAGSTVIDGPAGPFTLTARADRIDVKGDGSVITDYKTGASLNALRKDAEDGFAPQLALEAAIALANGFAGLDAGRVTGLRFISASGGEPAGAEVDLRCDDFAKLADEARAGLARLIARYDDPATPYRAVRRARFSYDYDDYAHLSRAAEWFGSDAEEE